MPGAESNTETSNAAGYESAALHVEMVPFLAENRTVPSREFTDEAGVLWRVWTTFPSNPKSVATDLRDGWLCFDSGEERRRIGPIPRDWERMTDERLQLVLRLAAPSRKTPPKGTPEANDCEDNA